MPRVAEVAPAAPPRRSRRAPSFPLGLAEMSGGSGRAGDGPPELGGRRRWLGTGPALPGPGGRRHARRPGADSATPPGRSIPRATPPAAACPAETRPLSPLRLDPFGGPRRGPNLRQRRRHSLRRVLSSAKDRPHAGTPIDF